MDFQAESAQPLFQCLQTLPCIAVFLETQYSVVSIPDYHHIPLRMFSTLVQPEVKL